MTDMADRYPVDARRGLLITAAGGFLYTFDLPLMRLAGSDGADKWTLIFSRGLFLFLSITAVWWLLRRVNGTNGPFVAGRAGWAVVATYTLANITYIAAITETAAANVVLITALIPIVTALLSRIFIGEAIHLFTWIASALSFLGVGIIFWDGFQAGDIFGNVLALISCFGVAGAFTIIRASGKNVATSLGLGSLVSAVIALGVIAWGGVEVVPLDTTGWFYVALCGLVVIPLASTLIANGPRFLPSADVSMFFLLETVLTPLWIFLLFKELPTQNVLIGGALVISTLVVHSAWRLASTQKQPGEPI
jgi:drug/metabolite transporter (DMT)-like permease